MMVMMMMMTMMMTMMMMMMVVMMMMMMIMIIIIIIIIVIIVNIVNIVNCGMWGYPIFKQTQMHLLPPSFCQPCRSCNFYTAAECETLGRQGTRVSAQKLLPPLTTGRFCSKTMNMQPISLSTLTFHPKMASLFFRPSERSPAPPATLAPLVVAYPGRGLGGDRDRLDRLDRLLGDEATPGRCAVRHCERHFRQSSQMMG